MMVAVMAEQTPDHISIPAGGDTLRSKGEREEAPPSGGTSVSLRRGFARNLRCAVRIALFRRVTAGELAAAPPDLALLAIADLALNLLLSLLLTAGEGTFTATALPSFFFHLPLLLLCGLMAGRLLTCPGLVTIIPAALITLSLPLELLHGLMEGAVQVGWFHLPESLLDAPHYYRFFLWWVTAGGLFLARLGPASGRRRSAILLVFLTVVVLPLWLFPRGDLWTGTGEEGGELRLTEEVLAVQPRLLDERLSGLLPGRKGRAGLYFVGFAGDGSQDVFMRELLAVERLFTVEFGATGRTVTLVNNPQTPLTQPFATASNLARALRQIGAVMNRDEDVLFLYLTSHGSRDQELTVGNGALDLDQVTPEMLRRMLAEAGIRWRVIAVSACFSGGFVDPLKDDHTLIMTASDATHESFGCSYGADFTWFGKAYFDEALRTTRSFTDAFTRARAAIREREKQEGETPSNPQIFVGKAMEQKLADMEKELAAGAKGEGR